MDISTVIEYIVLTTVAIVIIHFYKYLYLDIYINFIQIPMFGAEALIFPPSLSSLYRTFFSVLTVITTLPLIYIIFFYLLFYGIYLLIKWILDQGGLFFIHPLVSPLLDAPPFKQLIKFGVFKLIEGIFKVFGINYLMNKIIHLYITVYIFSYENIRYIFNLIAPNLGDEVIKYIKKFNGKDKEYVMNKLEEENEKKEKEKEEEANNPRKKIDKSVDVEISNNIKPITPDMDATTANNTNLNNSKLVINTYSKKIGDYIKLNYK